MNVTVVGLGKIGLPLAVHFAKAGAHVIGADVNPRTVDLVNRGQEPFPEEDHLAEYLAEVVAADNLEATTDTAAAVARSQVVVVVVPLFVDADGKPDFDWMDSATKDIARGLRPGTLVSYETTLPVGTTRNRFLPVLESGNDKGEILKHGKDFHLVFSPERVLTGRIFADLARYPKLVGGVDATAEDKGVEFYNAMLTFDDRPDLARPNGVWRMGSAEAAELAKLAETTYRDVNIGLANQFAVFAQDNGIDVYQVIEACNSQPFSHIHQPGIAVGGHCIPVYPRLYLSNDPDATVVRSAREHNAAMPQRTVELLERVHGNLEGQQVVILGASYRGGVKETAFSGVFATQAALQAKGAQVWVHDPYYDEAEMTKLGLTRYVEGQHVDAAIVHTAHAEYASWSPEKLPGIRSIVDGRTVLDPQRWHGIAFRVLGVASS